MIFASGDQTFFKVDESMLTGAMLTKINVVADKSTIRKCPYLFTRNRNQSRESIDCCSSLAANSDVIQLSVDKPWRRQLHSARGRTDELRANHSVENQCDLPTGIGQMQSEHRSEACARAFAFTGRRSSGTGATFDSGSRSNVAKRLRHVPSDLRRPRQFAVRRAPSSASAHRSTTSTSRYGLPQQVRTHHATTGV